MRKRILLIDDDTLTLNSFYLELINRYNFDVVWLKKADEAMDALNGAKYDAIILDVMMPIPEIWTIDEQRRADRGLSTGTVLFEKIRKDYPKIPILIYSAKGGVETDEYSYYFRKPEFTENIVNRLKKMIFLGGATKSTRTAALSDTSATLMTTEIILLLYS